MDLPDTLRLALDREIGQVPPADLVHAAEALMARYRAGHGTETRFAHGQGDAIAYAAYRMPATFGALSEALEAVAAALPEWRPRSALDIGAGPGTAAWAALETWPEIGALQTVERDLAMIDLGRRLADSGPPALREARWTQGDASTDLPLDPADLILVSYTLGELPSARRDALLARLWALSPDTLVVVEPGTPTGYGIVLMARQWFLGSDAALAAPCPHMNLCPMAGTDWCHFSARVPRGALHRRIKGGALAYEDEKYSYVAATRLSADHAPTRIVRHPLIRSGLISLELCTPDGLRTETITRRQKSTFRAARHAAWGDRWPPGEDAESDGGLQDSRSPETP